MFSVFGYRVIVHLITMDAVSLTNGENPTCHMRAESLFHYSDVVVREFFYVGSECRYLPNLGSRINRNLFMFHEKNVLFLLSSFFSFGIAS